MKTIFVVLVIALMAGSCNSQLKHDIRHDDIVIVNVGKRYRAAIAKEIAIINSFGPKVIALDTYFPDSDSEYTDSLLISVLNGCNRLVMMGLISNYTNEVNGNYQELTGSHPKFLSNAKIGFANSILEDDEFRTLRKFSIYEKVNGITVYHFAVRTAMEYDSMRTMAFVNGKPRVTDVEYIGDQKMFKTFSDFDVFDGKIVQEDIEGKIVLFGYIGPYDGYQGDNDEDKYFSPLNAKIPPYRSDMYGVVFHANIIAQILRNRK